MTKEEEIIQEKINRNWNKIKKINEIIEKTTQVIENFKKAVNK